MEHITYHPVDIESARTFASFTLDEAGLALATGQCAQRGLDQSSTDLVLQLRAHYAQPSALPFDQTHGFAVAAVQGLFGTYYYIQDGSLSALGDLIAPYAQPWQHTLDGYPQSETATNRLTADYSSGVYLAPNMIAQFMADTHAVPELTAALATAFPGEKAHVLWSALQHALDSGTGLLEARGVLLPNSADIGTSECHSSWANCDPTSLQHATQPTLAAVAAMAADQTLAASQDSQCQGQEGGLAARLRAKRMAPQSASSSELEAADADAAAFNDFVSQLSVGPGEQVAASTVAFEDITSHGPLELVSEHGQILVTPATVPVSDQQLVAAATVSVAAPETAAVAAVPTGWQPFEQISTETGTPVMRYQESADGTPLRVFAVA